MSSSDWSRPREKRLVEVSVSLGGVPRRNVAPHYTLRSPLRQTTIEVLNVSVASLARWHLGTKTHHGSWLAVSPVQL